MKGLGNQPTLEVHLELHAALLLELGDGDLTAGVGKTITRQQASAYIMRCTKVGTRQSVDRYLEAWEDLGLIVREREGRIGIITLLAAPEGLQIELPPAQLHEAGDSPVAA